MALSASKVPHGLSRLHLRRIPATSSADDPGLHPIRASNRGGDGGEISWQRAQRRHRCRGAARSTSAQRVLDLVSARRSRAHGAPDGRGSAEDRHRRALTPRFELSPTPNPYSAPMNGYATLVGGTKFSLIVLAEIQRTRFNGEPALSLVPEARLPPNGCWPTTAPVGLSLM